MKNLHEFTGTGGVGAIDVNFTMKKADSLLEPALPKKDDKKKKKKVLKEGNYGMSPEEFAENMLDHGAGESPEDAQAISYLDKLLLRIFENPSYLNYLKAYQYLKSEDVIELVFYRLPDEVMDEIKLIVSDQAEFSQFDDEHDRPMLGVKIPSQVWKEERALELNLLPPAKEGDMDSIDKQEDEEDAYMRTKRLSHESEGENGYVCFYKGKRHECYAASSYAAQKKAATHFGAKNSSDVSVKLAEKGGKQVTHTAVD